MWDPSRRPQGISEEEFLFGLGNDGAARKALEESELIVVDGPRPHGGLRLWLQANLALGAGDRWEQVEEKLREAAGIFCKAKSLEDLAGVVTDLLKAYLVAPGEIEGWEGPISVDREELEQVYGAILREQLGPLAERGLLDLPIGGDGESTEEREEPVH